MAVRKSVPVNYEPPHDEGAEIGLIGCAIANPELVVDLAVERGIRVNSFYLPAHQRIWETIEEMHGAGKLIDGVLLSNRLREKQVFEEVGGTSYLQRLVEAAPVTVHVESYLEVVKQKAVVRGIIQACREAVDKCYDPDKSTETLISETEQSFMNLGSSKNQVWKSWPMMVEDVRKEIFSALDEQRVMAGIPTGFKAFDDRLRGLKASEMIVLAARPSMGKTSLALNIAENIAMGEGQPGGRGKPVAVFSLEMSAESLVKRMICSRARVSSEKLDGGYVSTEMHQGLIHAAEELKHAPIFIDDAGGLDVMDMRSRARRLKKKHPDLALIVVDYLQISHCSHQAKDGWQREVAGISGELKNMAKELKVPVMVLSQLSRDAEKRDRTSGRPKLSDLRDSGAIEQDADVVFLLRRPCRYPEDPDREDLRLAVVDIAKNRNGGVGEVKLNFEEQYTRFMNRTEI